MQHRQRSVRVLVCAFAFCGQLTLQIRDRRKPQTRGVLILALALRDLELVLCLFEARFYVLDTIQPVAF